MRVSWAANLSYLVLPPLLAPNFRLSAPSADSSRRRRRRQEVAGGRTIDNRPAEQVGDKIFWLGQKQASSGSFVLQKCEPSLVWPCFVWPLVSLAQDWRREESTPAGTSRPIRLQANLQPTFRWLRPREMPAARAPAPAKRAASRQQSGWRSSLPYYNEWKQHVAKRLAIVCGRRRFVSLGRPAAQLAQGGAGRAKFAGLIHNQVNLNRHAQARPES